MNTYSNKNIKTLVFSRWSRKSYAVFSSLGKSIKIGRLSVEICLQASKILKKVVSFFSLDQFYLDAYAIESEIDDGRFVQELALLHYLPNTLTIKSPSLGISRFYIFQPKSLHAIRLVMAFFMSKIS